MKHTSTRPLAAMTLLGLATSLVRPIAAPALPEATAASVQNSTIESAVNVRDLNVHGGQARVGNIKVDKANLRNAVIKVSVTANAIQSDAASVDVGSVVMGEQHALLFDKIMVKNRARLFAANGGSSRSGTKMYLYEDDHDVRQQILDARETPTERNGETKVSIASPVISSDSKVKEVNIVVDTRKDIRVK